MNNSQLKARISFLEQELREARQQLSNDIHNPTTITSKLSESRAYSFDPNALSVNTAIKRCIESLNNYGFCVLENIIPAEDIPNIRQEISEAQIAIGRNLRAINELVDSEELSDQALLDSNSVELRPATRRGRPPNPPNDITWMPQYAQYLAHPLVVKVARLMLDDHIRIAQLHPKKLHAANPNDPDGNFFGYDRFGLPRLYGGGKNLREWHTDWPHDPWAYGGDNPNENIGCIRQPFPDVTMCLVMIWYLTDVDPDSGGTWVVPGSHKDVRTPRGTSDGITVSAPIPGEMQIVAPEGSVFIQDSRTWHSAPMHSSSTQERIAVINRWCPWWLSIDDYAPGSRYNSVCRPLSHSEYLALPKDLQPLMKHLCSDEQEMIQEPILKRSKEASKQVENEFRARSKNPHSQLRLNEHIHVKVELLQQ